MTMIVIMIMMLGLIAVMIVRHDGDIDHDHHHDDFGFDHDDINNYNDVDDWSDSGGGIVYDVKCNKAYTCELTIEVGSINANGCC